MEHPHILLEDPVGGKKTKETGSQESYNQSKHKLFSHTWFKSVNASTHSTRFKHDLHISINHRPILQADDSCITAHIRKYLKKKSHQQCVNQQITQYDLMSVCAKCA